MERKVVLTGFMATGKSVVAAALAQRLGWPLRDSDRQLMDRAGKPIDQIFHDDGEAGFRALERQVITQLASEPGATVIATGGGAIVDDSNFDALAAVGEIFCLTARPEVIIKRLGAGIRKRPKLLEGGKSLDVRIGELMAERAGAYARAHHAIDTSELTVDETVEQIVKILREDRCRRSA